MKTGYYHGERVYVYESGHYVGFQNIDWSKVQIFKHRDIVHALNELLKKIENADEKEINEPLGISFTFYKLLTSFHPGYTCTDLPFETKDENTFAFDNVTKIKRARTPRLYTGKSAGKFKVHKGGLYKPRDAVDRNEILSDEFKAWRKAETAKSENQNNV